MSNPSKNKIVAVTGMGIVSSLGNNINCFAQALKNGIPSFSVKTYEHLPFPVIGAFISNFNFEKELSRFQFDKAKEASIKKIIRSVSSPTQFAIIAALEASEAARLSTSTIDFSRIGLVVAAQNSGTHYQYDLYSSFLNNPEYLTPTYALNFMDTNYVGLISHLLNIQGEGFTVGGASASGNVALLRAKELIASGHQDICVVVGSAADLSPMDLQGFRNIGALGGQSFLHHPNEASRPFDRDHEGFIYGQASACIVLESLASAKKRAVAILGYFHGGALTLDGNYLSNPSIRGETTSMQKALLATGIDPTEINYINTHGSSSPLGDKTELAAIESFFHHPLMLNATKGLTGHCLWSAGMVEAIATLIQIKENFLHPNLNLIHPISQKSTFVGNHSQHFLINYALSNSFGFGGINSSIILSNKTGC